MEDPTIRQLVARTEAEVADERCTVAVLGEFSRGKSTLLNALLGRALLPVDIRPTTALVLALEHHPQDVLLTRPHLGERTKVPLDPAELRRAQTVATGGSENADDVRWIEVGLPEVQPGFRLLDTPGVNDLSESRPELVYRVLPFVDVAIFVLDGSVGLSASERRFLGERLMRSVRPRMIFFVNKMDRVVFEEGDDPGAYAEQFRTELASVVGGPVTVVFGSLAASRVERESTIARITAAIRAEAEAGMAARRRRLVDLATEEADARLVAMLEGHALTVERAQAALLRQEASQEALRATYGLFREHVLREGRGPLLQMIHGSLEAMESAACAELQRRIHLCGSAASYAEHALGHDAASLFQNWADRHAGDLRAYLERHRSYVAAEFERLFGDAFPLHRESPVAIALARVDTAHVDIEPLQARERATTMERYALPAVGSVLAGLVAAPFAAFGLAAGLMLAEHRRRLADAELRAELRIASASLVASASAQVRSELERPIDRYFTGMGTLLDRAFEARLDTSRRELQARATDQVARREEAGRFEERATRALAALREART
ncbi:MAG: dynamin family protein [Pseudomonadota bacterium]|nr:dynamin family protein [Pseudomonadota bacterium]